MGVHGELGVFNIFQDSDSYFRGLYHVLNGIDASGIGCQDFFLVTGGGNKFGRPEKEMGE